MHFCPSRISNLIFIALKYLKINLLTKKVLFLQINMENRQTTFSVILFMKKIISLLALALVLLSCKKEYDLAMKSADKDFIMKVANKKYEKKKWTDALALYERLTNLVAGTDAAPEVVYKSAYANYYDKNYKLAAHQFKNFAVTFTNDPRREESAYMSALCYYEGSMDYNLDQSNTTSAINELQDFLNNYPNSERSKNINELIDELNYKLEFKAYENARQYYKMADYKAATISFDNVLNDFPATKLKSKIYNYILKSKSELAIHSIYDLKKERLDNAIAFTRQAEREFPNSDNAKDAVEIRAKLEKEAEAFAKLQKEVEARKAEYTEKQKQEDARLQEKEQGKKQLKDQQTANKIKIDSAKINTPEPAATFKIRRN